MCTYAHKTYNTIVNMYSHKLACTKHSEHKCFGVQHERFVLQFR